MEMEPDGSIISLGCCVGDGHRVLRTQLPIQMARSYGLLKVVGRDGGEGQAVGVIHGEGPRLSKGISPRAGR
jgi:hypothetical protein